MKIMKGLACFFGRSMTVRARISWMLALLMGVFTACLCYWEVDAARLIIQEDIDVANRITIQLLGVLIQEGRASGQSISPADLVRFMEHAGAVRVHEIKLFNLQGELVYSAPSIPENTEFSVPRWFTRYVTQDVEPVVLNLPDARVQLTPDSSRSIGDVWHELKNTLLLTLAFILLVNGLMFVMVGRILAPLRHLVTALARLERLDYQVRLPEGSRGEMATLFHAFNRMAQALEENSRLRQQAAQTTRQLQENREVTALIQSHLEEERRLLARELHDELGQMLTAVSTIATSVVHQSTPDNPKIAQRAATIVDLSARMYDAMHRLVRELRPLALDQLGLADALIELVGITNHAQQALLVTLQLSGLEPLEDDRVQITAYRIVQEAINNTMRHARASQMSIRLHTEEQTRGNVLFMHLSDNGQGVDLSGLARTRFGLRGMRERVQGLGGRFQVHSQPGQGFTIEVALPVVPLPQEPSATIQEPLASIQEPSAPIS